jgi:hypothetical protein
MWLQRLDPIFNMEVDVMRPAFNLEPKYWVTMFTREEWTRGPGTPPVVKGLLWFTDESRQWRGLGLESIGNLWEEVSVFLKECKLQFFRLRYMTSWPVFKNFK